MVKVREPLLQIGVFPSDLQRTIDTEFQCCTLNQLRADPDTATRVQAILTRNIAFTPDVLDEFAALKIIATSSVGYDALPIEHAQKRNILVTNTPCLLDAAVCELAIGSLLSLLRDIPLLDRSVREGRWPHAATMPLATSLGGKTVGIVGMGRIGRGMASRLEPFGVRLCYTGTKAQKSRYRYVADLVELAALSDILVVCCHGGPETRHLIHRDVLAALGADGYLVNISRGSVVNEAALVDALTRGIIRGAALDVFEQEPLTDSPLFAMRNTVLTPHIGTATRETRAAMLRLALDNVHRVLAGESPITPI